MTPERRQEIERRYKDADHFAGQTCAGWEVAKRSADDVPALLAENAELRALLAQVTRPHDPVCPALWSAEADCDCGVEADRVQVAGLLVQEGLRHAP